MAGTELHRKGWMAFTEAEFRSRVDKVKGSMAMQGLDALLIMKPANHYYLAGLRSIGSFAFQGLIVTPDRDPVAIIRKNDDNTMMACSWLDDLRFYTDYQGPWSLLRQVTEELKLSGKTVGMETDAWHMPVKRHQSVLENMPGVKIKDASFLVEEFRLIKSPQEIAYMRQAGKIADVGAAAGIAAIKEGVWEYELGSAILGATYAAGNDADSTYLGIGSGWTSGLGHNSYRYKQVEKGDQVCLELGGTHHLYTCNLLRTVFVGDANVKFRKIYETIKLAHDEAIKAIRPGATVGSIDEICHKVVDDAGLGDQFTRRSGFSVGIFTQPDLWIEPLMSLMKGDTRLLQSGMCISVEPGINLFDGGCKIGDNILVTEAGHEFLTTPPEGITVV